MARCEPPVPVLAGSGCLVGVGRVSGRSQGCGRLRRGREAWKERGGAPASWNPGTPRRGPCQRSAAHPPRPCLTSRRGSPDRNALAWLPGPGRGRRRVIKGPGEVGGAPGPERSQSGGARAGTARAAGPPRGGRGQPRAAPGGERRGGAGAASRRAPGGLVERGAGTPVPGEAGRPRASSVGTQARSRAACRASLSAGPGASLPVAPAARPPLARCALPPAAARREKGRRVRSEPQPGPPARPRLRPEAGTRLERCERRPPPQPAAPPAARGPPRTRRPPQPGR